MAKGGKAKQRADRGQPRVARADAIAVVVLAMIEERTDQRGVELCDIQMGGLRDLAHGLAAKALETALNERKKGGTRVRA